MGIDLVHDDVEKQLFTVSLAKAPSAQTALSRSCSPVPYLALGHKMLQTPG